MANHYVLIDFENVQPKALHSLAHESFRVFVFVGASQTKMTIDLAVALQSFGDRAEYVQISGNGPNALDFHIAFYIGHLAAKDPDSFFHIISKDTGFDPLIKFLKVKKGIVAARVKSIADMLPAKPTASRPSSERLPVKKAALQPPPDRLAIIVKNLQHLKANKPRTLKTLANLISSAFQKKLSAEEIKALQQTLTTKGYIVVEGTRITYSLPG